MSITSDWIFYVFVVCIILQIINSFCEIFKRERLSEQFLILSKFLGDKNIKVENNLMTLLRKHIAEDHNVVKK